MTLKDLVQTARKARKELPWQLESARRAFMALPPSKRDYRAEEAQAKAVAAAEALQQNPFPLFSAGGDAASADYVEPKVRLVKERARGWTGPTFTRMQAGPARMTDYVTAPAAAFPALPERAPQTVSQAAQATGSSQPQPAQAVPAPAKPEVTPQQVQYAQGAAIGQVLGKRLMGLLQQKNKGASKAKETWWDGDEKRMRTDPIPAGYAERGIKGSGSDALKIFGASEGRASIDAAQQKAAQEYAARREFTATARQTPGGADMLRKQGITPREILKRVEKSMKKTRAAAGSQPTS